MTPCNIIQKILPILLIKYCREECIFLNDCNVQPYTATCLPWGPQDTCAPTVHLGECFDLFFLFSSYYCRWTCKNMSPFLSYFLFNRPGLLSSLHMCKRAWPDPASRLRPWGLHHGTDLGQGSAEQDQRDGRSRGGTTSKGGRHTTTKIERPSRKLSQRRRRRHPKAQLQQREWPARRLPRQQRRHPKA